MFRFTYKGIRIINMQTERKDRHVRRVMRIARAPCHRYVLNTQENNVKLI